MTDKKKAAQESSPDNSHTKYNTYLSVLRVIVIQLLERGPNPCMFNNFVKSLVRRGYTRSEVTRLLDQLSKDGVIDYCTNPNESYPLVYVKLLEVKS